MGQVCAVKNKKEGKMKLKNVDSACLASEHRNSNLNLIEKPKNDNITNTKEKIQIVTEFEECALYLDTSDFSQRICSLLLSYFDFFFTEYPYNSQQEFEKNSKLIPKNAIPYLPLLRNDTQWISSTQAICFFICHEAHRQDLLGKTPLEKTKLITILCQCEQIIKKLLEIKTNENKRKIQSFVEKEICPILYSLDLQLKEKKWLLEYMTLGDFYLYVILVQINNIYEYTYRNYFWLQKFKIAIDLLFSEKMFRNTTPTLKIFQTEFENTCNKALDESEILVDGKIPIEINDDKNEIEFLRDINYIPESLNKSIKITCLENSKNQ